MMALKKCPRCELNYILDDGALCTVCREEVHGKKDIEESAILCSVCGEAATIPGEDMCKACMAELRSVEMTATGAEDEVDEGRDEPELDPEPVSSLTEIEGIDDMEEEDPSEDVAQLDEDEALLLKELAEA